MDAFQTLLHGASMHIHPCDHSFSAKKYRLIAECVLSVPGTRGHRSPACPCELSPEGRQAVDKQTLPLRVQPHWNTHPKARPPSSKKVCGEPCFLRAAEKGRAGAFDQQGDAKEAPQTLRQEDPCPRAERSQGLELAYHVVGRKEPGGAGGRQDQIRWGHLGPDELRVNQGATPLF